MKKIFLSFAICASITLISCGNSVEKKQDDGAIPHDTTHGVSAQDTSKMKMDNASLAYICPCGGCPEIKESKPGTCSKCGLELVEQKK